MSFQFSSTPPAWDGAADPYPEGNLGARFGNLVVSTPNANVMYAPLCDAPVSIIFREGAHFGVQDYMMHPQIYSLDFLQAACLPTPTHIGENAILFYRLKRSDDWEIVSSFEGLGRIKAYTVGRLTARAETVAAELDKLIKDGTTGLIPSLPRDKFPIEKMRRLRWHIRHYTKILGRPGSYDDCLLCWANTQRVQLDIRSH